MQQLFVFCMLLYIILLMRHPPVSTPRSTPVGVKYLARIKVFVTYIPVRFPLLAVNLLIEVVDSTVNVTQTKWPDPNQTCHHVDPTQLPLV